MFLCDMQAQCDAFHKRVQVMIQNELTLKQELYESQMIIEKMKTQGKSWS